MIKAVFTKSEQGFNGFSVLGHAEYAAFGEDVACASVTSAVQLTVNAIIEVLKIDAKLNLEENKIELKLPSKTDKLSQAFLEALLLHLQILSEDFKGTLKVKVSEVQNNA